MAELKWYRILKVLFGTILSIADPITDILTLREFYRAGHKTWFGVGVTSIIFPTLFFLYGNFNIETDRDRGQWTAWKCTRVLVLGCNPLLPAWLKLRTLIFYLKKFRQGSNTDQTGEDSELRKACKFVVLAEAALESAPQFIIQLYAMAVEQQSVKIVQMVSLPVSFLSMAWASIVADEFLHSDEGDLKFSVKDRVLHYVTHLFISSSRLFAVALFTVSFKWWVASVLIFHCTVMAICDTTIWLCSQRDFSCRKIYVFVSVLFFCFHWLRDDLSMIITDKDTEKKSKRKHFRRIQLVSNVLFVIENITMILLFYFIQFPHTWYSLPVTICVCLFSVLGAGMRLTRFYFLRKDPDDQSYEMDQVPLELYFQTLPVVAKNEGRLYSHLVFVRLSVCDLCMSLCRTCRLTIKI